MRRLILSKQKYSLVILLEFTLRNFILNMLRCSTCFLSVVMSTDVLLLSAQYLFISVADPDQGSGAFLTPGSGMGKKTGSDEQPESSFLELRNHFLC